MADYKKIVQSQPFTFLVGSNRDPLAIHTAIVKDLSAPLHVLINNGHMKESQTGVAILDDAEVDTFVGFCEYAYTGVYNTPDFSNQSDDPPVSDDSNLPGPEPEKPKNHEFWDDWNSWSPLVRRKKEREASKKGIPPRIKIPHDPETTPESDFGAVPPIDHPYQSMRNRFRSLNFNGEIASLSPNPDILFHAKLYVFATKYLIEGLRQQCLASMHRDLSKFSLNQENKPRVLDLLDFTYTHTGRAESGGKSPLRDLVIHYVACNVRTLTDDEKFAELLDSNAEVGSDLVLKIVR